MRPHPLLGLAAVALALAVASCGTPAAPIAQDASSIGVPLPEDDATATLPPVPQLRLSVDDALLHGDDAPAPWDMKNRNVETFAYDIGPNQTDCGPYWEYERLARLQGGETMWWRDGGNLNNRVRREGEPGQAAALMKVLADLPQTCGVTSWSEGDSFTIEAVDLVEVPGAEGIVALSIDHVRTDEVLWLAFAQRGDLISELRVTMWAEFESGRIPSFSPVDFATVAATMAARLDAAGPDDAAPATSTTTTVPGERPTEVAPTVPPESLDDDPPVIDQLPPDMSVPTIDLPPTTAAPLGELAAALLVTDDLPPLWTADRATVYDGAEGDDEALAGCPESAVIVELDKLFEYSTELANTDVETWEGFGVQFIAVVDDAEDLTNEVLAVDGCVGTENDTEYRLSATAVEVDGADAAVLVYVDQTQQVSIAGDADGPGETQRYVLAVAAVGTTLTAFSVSTAAPVTDFLQRGVDKIVASGPF